MQLKLGGTTSCVEPFCREVEEAAEKEMGLLIFVI